MTEEPQQLTLWPDNALPGQMPLFNRKAEVGEVGVLPEEVSGYCQHCESVVVRHLPGHLCFHCETLIAEYLARRKTAAQSTSPAAEPMREPDDWFGKRPQMDLVPTADAYL